jgi:hypothetical protein
METATDHYVKHLGPVYCWMVGDLQAASLRAVSELDALAAGMVCVVAIKP